MYCLSDQQIDYILDDISARGVKMESLQQNLLDHVCCIIEQNLEENGDFELFYATAIKTFYKTQLSEIEDETILLLTFKNYYAMRKTMLVTGAISAAAFILGSFLKLMVWPGAGLLLLLGFVMITFLFLPLLFIIKAREVSATRDKLILATGTFSGILYCISMLFLVNHWQGAHQIWMVTLSVTAFLFLPSYFFTGIRKEETRVNTIVSTIILVAVIGIQFTLTAMNKPATDKLDAYIQSELLLEKIKQSQKTLPDTAGNNNLAQKINYTCQEVKQLILQSNIGQPSLPENLDDNKRRSLDDNLDISFAEGKGSVLLKTLKQDIEKYNAASVNPHNKIPTAHTIVAGDLSKPYKYNNLVVLNNMTQIQLFLISTEKDEAISMK